MPLIKNEVLIHADLETVYNLAREVERFPDFMPDIESVDVKERSADGTRLVTEWVGVASDFKLKVRWTEEDLWDQVEHTCRFTQITGDYQEYEGLWSFIPEGERLTRFTSEIKYELEIPLIGPLLKALVAKLAKENVQRILEAIKIRSEQQQPQG